MNLARLLCTCECGSYSQPVSFWLTDQKQLLISAVCVSCERQFNILFPLTELYTTCPKPDIKQLDQVIGRKIEEITDPSLPPKPVLLTEQDERFLRALKITFTAP